MLRVIFSAFAELPEFTCSNTEFVFSITLLLVTMFHLPRLLSRTPSAFANYVFIKASNYNQIILNLFLARTPENRSDPKLTSLVVSTFSPTTVVAEGK